MTSIVGTYAQIPANKLYINITNIASSIVDSNNVSVPWVVSPAALGLQTAGGAVLRDMGRYIYKPDPTVPTSVGSQSSILRKVQLVPQGATNGYYGTGNVNVAVPGSQTDFYTGYIRLGGQTYGGGGGAANATLGGAASVPTGVARLN
jgi:hypothetical protein